MHTTTMQPERRSHLGPPSVSEKTQKQVAQRDPKSNLGSRAFYALDINDNGGIA